MNTEVLTRGEDLAILAAGPPPLSPTSLAVKQGDLDVTKKLVVSVMTEVNSALGIDLGNIDIAEVVNLEEQQEEPVDDVADKLDQPATTKRSREGAKGEFTHAHLVCEACGFIVMAVAQAVIQAVIDSHSDGTANGSRPVAPPKKKRGGILGFKELAAKAKLSPWHFHRVFRSVTDVTPKAYGEASWEHLMRRYGFEVDSTSPTGMARVPVSPDGLMSPSGASNGSPQGISTLNMQVSAGPILSPGNDNLMTPKSSGAVAGGMTSASGRTNVQGRVQKPKARSTSRARSRSRTRPHSQTQQQVMSTLSSIQRARSRDRGGDLDEAGMNGLGPLSSGHMGSVVGLNSMGDISESAISNGVSLGSLSNQGTMDGLGSMGSLANPAFRTKAEDTLLDPLYADVGSSGDPGLFVFNGPDSGLSNGMSGSLYGPHGTLPRAIPESYAVSGPSDLFHPAGSYDSALKSHVSHHHRTLSHHAASGYGRENMLAAAPTPQSPPLELPNLHDLSLQKLPSNGDEWLVGEADEPSVEVQDLLEQNFAFDLEDLNGGIGVDPMDALNNLPHTFYMTEEQKSNFDDHFFDSAAGSLAADSHIQFPEGLEEPPHGFSQVNDLSRADSVLATPSFGV